MTPEEFMTTYERCTNSHDFAQVLPLLAEDAVYWFTDGTFQGAPAIQAAFERTWAAIDQEVYTLQNLRWLAQDDQFAVCLYEFHWQGIINGQLAQGRGRGTNLMKRQDGRWVMTHEHLSSMPR